jgi:hypothetical protein
MAFWGHLLWEQLVVQKQEAAPLQCEACRASGTERRLIGREWYNMGTRVLLQGGGKTGEVGRLSGGRGDGSSPAVRSSGWNLQISSKKCCRSSGSFIAVWSNSHVNFRGATGSSEAEPLNGEPKDRQATLACFGFALGILHQQGL